MLSLQSAPITPTQATQNNENNIQTKATYDWVFMVYLDGDNNLESAAIDDFKEMASIGSTSDVAIVTLFDRWTGVNDEGGYDDETYDNWTTTKLYFVDYNEEPYASNADEDWGEKNMGSPDTLYQFVSYVLNNYPATHYALILWDHGAGIFGSAVDEDNGEDLLEAEELVSVLRNVYENYGIKIDVLGMDMCIMGLFETAYNLWNYVDYIVFSEEYEPGDGWPYDDILNYLTSNPTATPAELAKEIVNYYLDSYGPFSFYSDENVTLSVVNLTALRYAVPKLNSFVGYILRYFSTFSSDISESLANAEAFAVNYGYGFQKDLLHFLELFRDRISDSLLEHLINMTYDSVNGSIVEEGHYGGRPNAHGLAMAFNDTPVSYYSTIPMSEEQQWVSFVKKIEGYDAGLWIYNISLSGEDSDSNGYLDSNLELTVDLDTDTGAKNVSVEVYAYDGENYIYLGASPYFVVSGATSDDSITFGINSLPQGIYQLKIKIIDNTTLHNVVKDYGLYAMDALVDVKLEVKDTEPPSIEILSPANGTTIEGLSVTIQINISDDVGVDRVEVYANDTLKKTIHGEVSTISITLDEYGWYVIKIVVYDTSGKTNQEILIIKLVEEKSPSGEQTGGGQTGGSTYNIPIDTKYIALAVVAILILLAIVLLIKRR